DEPETAPARGRGQLHPLPAEPGHRAPHLGPKAARIALGGARVGKRPGAGEKAPRGVDQHLLLGAERQVHRRSARTREAEATARFFWTSSVPAAIVLGTFRAHWRWRRPRSGAPGASAVSCPPRPRIS